MKAPGTVGLVLWLAGCASPAPPVARTPELPAAFADSPAQASAVLAQAWWVQAGEPALDALVHQALASNLSLQQAASRVDEAGVALRLARAAQWPTLELGAGAARSRVSTLNGSPVAQAEASTHRVALASSFELDLWGKLRHADQAAQAQLLAAEHARDTVRLATVGALVQAWWGLRALDAQAQMLARQQQLRQDSLALAHKRVQGGVASGLDVAQAEAALAALAVQQAELLRQRALLQNVAGALSGQPGLVLPTDPRALPAPQAVPAGLPSQLLTRRPDVAQAEASMRAAFAQFDVVKKTAWPTLSLTGTLGAQSQDLADLLKSGARAWSIAPALLVSLFDAGRNEARAAEARSRAEQAALAWQRAAQQAFAEVADALANAQHLATQEQAVQRQQLAAREALRIAQRRYENGYSAYLDVLDAQRGTLDTELALLRLRQQRLDAGVALAKALGGGWQAR